MKKFFALAILIFLTMTSAAQACHTESARAVYNALRNANPDRNIKFRIKSVTQTDPGILRVVVFSNGKYFVTAWVDVDGPETACRVVDITWKK